MILARRGTRRVLLRSVAGAALILGAFAVVGTGLVAGSHLLTRERIAANERAALLRSINQVIPPGGYDNDPLQDLTRVSAPALLGTPRRVPVYRVRRDGAIRAVVLTPVAPDGYNGRIRLLVGVRADGRISGVRVLSHRETPGLGDAIELERSDWIRGFRGKSLGDPPAEKWAVKRDGGAFDQLTGATITPRAVVAAVRRTLEYVARHHEELFETAGETAAEVTA